MVLRAGYLTLRQQSFYSSTLFSLLSSCVLIFLLSFLDMDVLKRKRSAQGGAITRILNKCQNALSQDPSELDPSQLDHQIDAIKSSDLSYRAIHQTIADKHEDIIDFDEEAEILAKHDESVEQAISLTQRLIAIHTVHSTAMELHHRVDTMERKQRDSPDKIYSTLISAIVEDYRQLQTTLRRSAIPASHSTRLLGLGN